MDFHQPIEADPLESPSSLRCIRASLSLFLSYFFPREKSPILLLGSSEFDDFPSALIALGLNLLGCFACGISENLESASFLSAREASAVVVESLVKF